MPIKIQPASHPKVNTSAAKSTDAIPWWNKDIQLWKSGMKLKERESFYTELSTLLSAGLDIQKSLQLIEKSRSKKSSKTTTQQIQNTIINGDSLSQAMRKTGEFSDYEIYTIQIGEETGRLTDVLEELSKFYAKSIKYQQKLIGAFSYPVFVIGFALLVVWFLLKYLVPLFSDIYQRFDGDLPLITQKIILLSNWLGEYSWLIFLCAMIIFGLLYFQRKKKWFRHFFSAFLLKFPLFGSIIRHIYLARFCQSMGFLLESRVSLTQTVQLVQKMIQFYPIEKSMEQAHQNIINGMTLHTTLNQHSFYPEQLIALVNVGEETGKVDKMFLKLSEQYNTLADEKTALISSLLEPVLIIGLGIIVGIILVAMYLPLFQMSTNFL